MGIFFCSSEVRATLRSDDDIVRRWRVFVNWQSDFLIGVCVVIAGEGELDGAAALVDRQAAINRQKEEAKKRRRKKKRTGSSLFASTFNGNLKN